LQRWRERSNQALFLRYEDLICAPHKTIQSVLGYLEVDNSPSTLCRIIDNMLVETSETLKHRTSHNQASSIGRWKYDLSEPLQKICQDVLGNYLLEAGYDL